MANVARRSALKFLAALPFAGPAAASAAASKMGMGTLMGGAAFAKTPSRYASETCTTACEPISTAQRILNYRDDLAFWKSSERRDAIRSQYRRMQVNLDPDLASMSSLSPSAARFIQIERIVDAEIREHVSSIERWINDLLTGKDR